MGPDMILGKEADSMDDHIDDGGAQSIKHISH